MPARLLLADDDEHRMARVNASLWLPVDAITKPSTQRLTRTPDADTTDPPWIRRLTADPTVEVCSVARYRAELRRQAAQTRTHGTVPSLWQQALAAITTGSEQSERPATPLRERSPADLDLMDLMLAIRETVGQFHQRRNKRITPARELPAELRALASAVIRNQPGDVDEWAARVAQWERMLRTHLADSGEPHPVRLRNSPCPACGARHVVLPTPEGPKVFPPLLVDFDHGMIRAATCSKCHRTWWRGDDLGHLAELLDTPARGVMLA